MDCRPTSAPVFPAYAGMFLTVFLPPVFHFCFPRIRGDVPAAGARPLESRLFSPHTRGCSGLRHGRRLRGLVFPAYAGMFRPGPCHQRSNSGFPRIRGDVPLVFQLHSILILFSPHTRGCSSAIHRIPDHGCVFPAYAGMFLGSTTHWWRHRSFPRIRGDVPIRFTSALVVRVFSPHTRGCSAFELTPIDSQKVFPAYAGMFPATPPAAWGEGRFPRIRGDVPKKYSITSK